MARLYLWRVICECADRHRLVGLAPPESGKAAPFRLTAEYVKN
jgi:hypothetical protein